MLTQEQIEKKLFQYAEEFEQLYIQKNYFAAKNRYETAERVAMFVDYEGRDKLFMSQGEDRDENPIWGAFNQDHVSKAYLECIKRGQTYDNKTYEQTYYGQKNRS